MKKVFLFLLISGIVLRFFLQFVFPVFNVDEISLGNNIKHLSFVELLYPLQFSQSSPPLFLWLEKFFITILPFNFWLNIKILSFISSISGLVLFYVFIKKNDFKIIFLLLFVIFVFNPFNISNSLTVKQYTMDLTGILFLLVFFKDKWFKQFNWIFFMLWCLMSNIGLFACAGYLLHNCFRQNKKIQFSILLDFIKKNKLTILSPIPYLVYFVWFMKQNGAIELKEYMEGYWRDSFIPLNSGIFRYLFYTFHGLWIFLFNSFEVWGFFLMLLIIPFFVFLKKKEMLFKEEICLLFWILSVHLVLNVFHLYPFSDRLYLYVSPLLLLLLGASLEFLSKLKWMKNAFVPATVFVSIVTMFLYCFYLPATDNDIVHLNKKLEKLNVHAIYVTKKVNSCIKTFNDFTDDQFAIHKDFVLLDDSLDKSGFIISRVGKKIKMNVSSPEEIEIVRLIDARKILLIDTVNGYNIYKINTL